ncbi:MAG: hypothetical protein Q8P75_00415 [bacterium]|nr:hypothetical protein [bacterium]
MNMNKSVFSIVGGGVALVLGAAILPTAQAHPAPPADASLHFISVNCPSWQDITGNAKADRKDETGGHYVDFTNYSASRPHFPAKYSPKPVDPAEIPANCARTSGRSFKLSTDQRQTKDVFFTPLTDSSGEVIIPLSSLDTTHKKKDFPKKLWVSENPDQNIEADFAALRCYNNARNGDNLELVSLDKKHPADIYCIAYNIALPPPPPPPAPTISAVSPNNAPQFSPSIYGNIVAWADYRTNAWEVYYKNLATGEAAQISNVQSQGQIFPHVYEHNIVYGVNDAVYLYNTDNGQTARINSDLAKLACPDIYGNRVVWRDNRYSDEPGNSNRSDIYLLDLTTGEERSLSGSVLLPGCPRIQGDRVVWDDMRNPDETGNSLGNSDIYLYDLSTDQETHVTTALRQQNHPDIYGNIIVWTDFRNDNPDVYMYDITTGQETQLSSNIGSQGGPAIYGTKIVWFDTYYDNPGDIVMYDIVTGETTLLTNFPGTTQSSPDIYENTIVWMDYRPGVPNIYMYR